MAIPIAAADLTWLLMDRPNNLMHVHGLLTFDERPDWDELNEAIFDRIVTRYRVLTQRAIHRHGHWVWEDDHNFSLERHMQRVILPDSSQETLLAYLSGKFSEPFDRQRPLWDMLLVSGPPQESDAGVFLCRFHHGIGDGIRLVQLLLGMCDPSPHAIPHAVGRQPHGRLETAGYIAKHTVRDASEIVTHAVETAGALSKSLVTSLNPLRLPHKLETGLNLLRHPVQLTDALTDFASHDNELSNSVREVSRMLLLERAETGVLEGHPSGDKAIHWVEGIPLDEIKTVAKAYGGTLNDALMATVSLALTAYLRERGVDDMEEIGWMMPISLEPLDATLPATLGNHFAVVVFSMPLGIDEPIALMKDIHLRAIRLKHSVEPALAFGFQWAIAEAPAGLAKTATEFFSNKTIGQLSNVPGPRKQLTLVGAPVTNVLGWVPTTGDQPLGVCVFTYNGKVSVGVSADTRMIPEPARITTLIEEKARELLVTGTERLEQRAARAARRAADKAAAADAVAAGAVAGSGGEGAAVPEVAVPEALAATSKRAKRKEVRIVSHTRPAKSVTAQTPRQSP